MPKLPKDLPWEEGVSTDHPVFGPGIGAYAVQALGDPGGLTQFGANIERVAPGSRTSNRHWHSDEDEFAYVLEGELTLIEDDGAHPLVAGDAVAWPAGVANAHCLENRSDRAALVLLVGTRAVADRVTYPDIDRVQIIDGESWSYTRLDGTPLDREEER